MDTLIWERIEAEAGLTDGFIRTRQIEALGVRRHLIRGLVNSGRLTTIRKGLYFLTDGFLDEYYSIQCQSPMAVFGYGTALFLWGLSDRIPQNFNIIVPTGANTTRLRRNNANIICHYTAKERYPLGITETTTAYGNVVKLYNKERCLCDIIRSKDKIDLQIYAQAIKGYFKTNPDYPKLIQYAKQLGVEKKVRDYMEVL